MLPRPRFRPILERLEDRTVPATVRLVGGDLLVSAPLIVGNQAGLTLNATANNTFQVIDTEGGHASINLGNYYVAGNIDLFGSNAKDNLVVNMKGFTYTGNLLVSSGNGNDTTVIAGNLGGSTAGTIAGNVTLIHGPGNATDILNGADSSVTGSDTAGLNIGGSVVAENTVNGFNTFQLGNASATTKIGGTATLYGFADNGTTPGVQIGAGQLDTIGGRLTVTNPNSLNASVQLGAQVGANSTTFQGVTVGGLYVSEGSGNDTVTFLGASDTDYNTNVETPGIGTTINGDTYVSLGNGNDFFNVPGERSPANPGGGESMFNGNVTYTAGNGNDSISLAGGPLNGDIGTQIEGNLSINLGDGNNDFGDLLPGTPPSQNPTGNGGFNFQVPTVDGNFSLTAGNGNNTMAFFGLNVEGNEAFHFGNGNNGSAALPMLIRRPSSGTLTYTAGNGNNFLQLATPLIPGVETSTPGGTPGVPSEIPFNPNFHVNIHFGNGLDTLVLGSAPGQELISPSGPETSSDVQDQGGVLSGTVTAGNNPNNVFIQNALWTIAPNFTLAGFP